MFAGMRERGDLNPRNWFKKPEPDAYDEDQVCGHATLNKKIYLPAITDSYPGSYPNSLVDYRLGLEYDHVMRHFGNPIPYECRRGASFLGPRIPLLIHRRSIFWPHGCESYINGRQGRPISSKIRSPADSGDLGIPTDLRWCLQGCRNRSESGEAAESYCRCDSRRFGSTGV